MDNNQVVERELNWDDQIVQEGNEFIVIPAGIYDFKVIKFERSRFNGSDKMPACNQAVLQLEVNSTLGKTILLEKLFLHSKSEWKLSEFFTCIGQKKKGEPLKMNWTLVPGAVGRAEIEINKYKDKNGNERTNNKVKKYLPKEQDTTPMTNPTFQSGTF
ncbi:hypothetical protein [Beduini massiliensis]|uniref:hypothetical protein n=1 Tax=Beduini massiliensis TaxID=1585974 RepID=UPI00059A8ED9|nr:hypothetical protein [Beduini massiliensis]